jgi:CheY-like chemotaxis protein
MRLEQIELEEPFPGSHGSVPPGDYVLLTVRDTGSGMDRSVLEHLFEPFFTTKELGKGTGLGLATVHGIIRQSGGHVSVESAPENGSTFSFFLPRVEEEATANYQKSEHAPRGVETLLLVEDEAGVREVTRRILTGLGYNVLVASSGPEAIELVMKYHGPLHLLVTDVVMPGMGGNDLARRLRELRTDLKVLFVSGYTDDSVLSQGVFHEKVNFLQKPHSPRVLAAKVRSILDQPAPPAARLG